MPEHRIDVIRHADWIVHVGLDAGVAEGSFVQQIAGDLQDVKESLTRQQIYNNASWQS